MNNINTWAELNKRNLNRALLYANRIDMIEDISISSKPTNIAEIGVALGDFSEILINSFKPHVFDAYDLFELHTGNYVFGLKSSEIFLGKTHEKYYNDKLKNAFPDTNIGIYPGDSSSNLLLSNCTYDLIYIDGDHRYDGVLKDTNAALNKISDNGIIIFNDYITHDKYHNIDYGVVQVVNNLLSNSNWKVIGYALNHSLFCDIALQRAI